ncbi:MAG: biotin/lipoyl-containing protein [Planctomycetota bacterium]
MKYFVKVGSTEHEVELVERSGELTITVDGAPLQMSMADVDGLGQYSVVADGRAYAVSIDGDTQDQALTIAGDRFDVELEDERERAANAAARAKAGKGGVVKSVMPGVVVEVLVEPGAEVEAGQPLLILEAMKMQNEIEAPVAGTVTDVFVAQGQAVGGGEKLASIKAAEEE